ncbi:perilipin-2-like isoform X2 [Dromaius novaehollandiae]|uniref:perilipin-2-like isoform X2 n=1 Tax=Dromaius novaehollandiae TaxID=8790 RepID=UPI00311EACD6
MALAAIDLQQNAISRVANLPLVSSTYNMVSTAYVTTKDNHPHLKLVCEIVEKGVKTITSVAVTSAMPIIQKLEPQIAVANNYARIGLDKIEEKLPILYQPTNEVVANAKDVVVGAREAVRTTVTGAKKTAHTITGVVGKTKEAIQGSVEMTKSVVGGSINAVLESCAAQMVSCGMDSALGKSEILIDQYLPCTEEELEKEVANIEGFEVGVQKPSYYVRLGSLSSKVCVRTYQQALSKARDAKHRSQETISQLSYTVNLIEYAKNMISVFKLLDTQEMPYQFWVEWKKNTGQNDSDELHSAEIIDVNVPKVNGLLLKHIESRALAIAWSLTQQLQTTCLTLASSIQGLPQNVQDQVYTVGSVAGDVYRSFRSASSFRELSDNFLPTSKGQLKKVKESLNDVIVHLFNNALINCLALTCGLTSWLDVSLVLSPWTCPAMTGLDPDPGLQIDFLA